MSKKQLISTIFQELKNLNQVIDMKIIRGVSYQQDALRHKKLLSQLGRETQNSKLTQVFSFLSML
ncbi:MAG: hypothetical protein Q8R29_03485 [bacterium]|nr:hypothetical protein [bacterium]